MREEIKDLIFILADLKDRMKKSKHPQNLKAAYKVSSERLKTLYELEEQLLDLKYKTPEHEHLVSQGPIMETHTDGDVFEGVDNLPQQI